MKRALLLVAVAGFLLGGAATIACSGDDDVAPAMDASADSPKAPPDGETEEDAATEAAVVPVVLPACVGPSLPMEVDGRRAHLDVTFGYAMDAGADADASTAPLPRRLGTGRSPHGHVRDALRNEAPGRHHRDRLPLELPLHARLRERAHLQGDVLQEPDSGIENFTVPNVPTVPIAIAGVDALAQLDTGYEDRLVPHSINVNRALFDKIEAKDFSLLQRDPKRDIFVTTCVPYLSEAIEAYALKTGQTFDFIAEGGSVARKETTVEIYVKKSTPETKKCGGIGTWTVPAAQIGSSFYVDMQAIVFDPKSSRVWIPKN